MSQRATQEHLTLALGHLEELAYTGSELYPHMAMLLDLLVWLEGEITAAREAAAYGSGAAEIHVLGTSSNGVDTRLNDQFLRDLRRMRRSWRSQVDRLVYDLQGDAHRVANRPTHTTETG